MPHCRHRECREQVPKLGDLCPAHEQILLERIQRHLSEEDSRFLIEHIDGCTISEVAQHLGLQVDTIDTFLISQSEELTFGGPKMFLGQRLLVRVLLHRDKLEYFEEELKNQEAVRKAKVEQADQPLPPVAEIKEEPRRVSRADDELVARDIEGLTGIEGETIRRWMINELIPYETKPWGGRGKIMRVVTRADLIAFFQTNLGNRRFHRYAGNFRQFLEDNNALPEQVTTEIPIESEELTRYGGIATDELTAGNIAHLIGVSDVTIRRWVDEGLLPYEERPLGDKGRMMKVVKMAELVAFVQSCFGNRRFARHGERFSRFLRKQTNKRVAVS